MKTYKDFEKVFIGCSDIATLIIVGYKEGEGVVTKPLTFGGDNLYSAYIVTEKAKIGDHYDKVETLNNWLKIYDDTELSYKVEAKEINIYRAGMYGCIIQIIQ